MSKHQQQMAANLKTRGEKQSAAQGPMYSVGQMLPIDSIRMDGGTQARAGLDNATVAEYAETWLQLSHEQNGFLKMPPIVVFHDGSSYWLADGFHRVVAYRNFLNSGSSAASPRAIRAAIQQGTQRDAILFACGANDTHGLRRSSADKRRAAATLLRDTEWGQWSDSEIGRRVSVDHKTVASVRAELVATGEIPGSSVRQSADGKVRDVSGISESNARRKATPAPAAPTDLPPEYAIVQRRLAAHGVELLSNMQGRERAFVTREHGGTGIVAFDWSNVLDRLSLLEDGMETDPAPEEQPKMPEVAADPRAALEARGWAFVPAESPRGWFRLDHPEIGYVRQEPTIEEAIKAATGLQANYDRRASLAAAAAPAPILVSHDPALFATAQASYSADKLMSGKMKKPFAYDGRLWINVAGGYAGGLASTEIRECVAVVLAGTAYTPGAHNDHFTRGSYRGQRASAGRVEYELTGQWLIVHNDDQRLAPVDIPVPTAAPAQQPAHWLRATHERFTTTTELARWCAGQIDRLSAEERELLSEEMNQLIIELEQAIEALA